MREITERIVKKNPWRYNKCKCGKWKLKRSDICRFCYAEMRPAPIGILKNRQAGEWIYNKGKYVGCPRCRCPNSKERGECVNCGEAL